MTNELFKADPIEIAEAITSISSGMSQESFKADLMSISDATKLYLMSKGLLLTMINLELDVNDQEVWDSVATLSGEF